MWYRWWLAGRLPPHSTEFLDIAVRFTRHDKSIPPPILVRPDADGHPPLIIADDDASLDDIFPYSNF